MVGPCHAGVASTCPRKLPIAASAIRSASPRGARERAGLGERLLRAGHVTGAAARLGQAEQEVAVLVFGLGEQCEPTFEVGRRLLVGEAPERLFAGAACVLDRLRELRARLRVVVRELAEVTIEVLFVLALERLGDPTVQPRAPRSRRASRRAPHG